MESTTPGGPAPTISTPVATQINGQTTRPNKSQGRRKPRPQQGTGVNTPNPADINSQQGNRQRIVPDGIYVQGTGSSAQQKSYNRHRPRKLDAGGQVLEQDLGDGSSSAQPSINSGSSYNWRRRYKKPPHAPQLTTDDQSASDRPGSPTRGPTQPGGNRRRAKFQGKLTDQDGASQELPSLHPSQKYSSKTEASPAEDLTSRLIRELSSPPYPDCPICFSSIYREQPIWSCSPSIATILLHGAEGPPQYCWTTFHLKCIRAWASKSVKDVEDAWRARGEEGKTGDWRCPGCQGKREIIPKVYWCFCGPIADPRPPRLATPHSCGGPCSRVRETECGHPCPLSCHPGPCPPCQVTVRLTCHCPRKSIVSFRCGIDQNSRGNLSCGNVCGRMLSCSKHACEKVCHEGGCDDCPIRETAHCWCGKSEKELRCGEGESRDCFVDGETSWVGRFACDQICERKFDCDVHSCQKNCHPPSSKPAPCPRSPANVTHCPCGRSSIAPTPISDFSSYTFPARESCSSPIPTCNGICDKSHERCGHPCQAQCHPGSCPPCSVELTRPCRCGAFTQSRQCHELYKGNTVEEVEILCERPCMALRACGRHECRRPCCPLASLAIATGGKKGKKRLVEEPTTGARIGEERGGLHECDLVCPKMLSCGNHRCEEKDHRGACPPCLRSSFEEMVCFCGRTIYDPPIPCGTVMHCSYPCLRPPPHCGHPRILHACHEDPSPCPPCVHLTPKPCACGKKIVPNIRCSLESEKVSCGTVCGKLLSCGFHHCERSCHAGDCGQCTATCGKLRKLCLPDHHFCPLPCHAPSSCSESEICLALVTVTCPCGRIQQAVRCGRSSTILDPSRPITKCTNDCGIAKRNARLAEALGINPTTKSSTASSTVSGYGSTVNTVIYSDDVIDFARVNLKFLGTVEKAFGDFITSTKKTQVLPHMTLEKRKFVYDLATFYRLDVQLVDQEPNRSVQLGRRIDTRIPAPLLSSSFQGSAAPNLGKLADFRNLRPAQSPVPTSGSSSNFRLLTATGSGGPSWRPSSSPSPKPGIVGATSAGGANTGWSAVVAPQPQAAIARSSGLTTSGTTHSRPQSIGPITVRPVLASNEHSGVVDAGNDTPSITVPENWEDDI